MKKEFNVTAVIESLETFLAPTKATERQRRYRVAVMGATVVCSRKVMSGKISPLLMPAVTVILLRLALLLRTRERPFTYPSVYGVVALLAAESNSAPDSKSPGVLGHGLRFIRLHRRVGGARTRCRRVAR